MSHDDSAVDGRRRGVTWLIAGLALALAATACSSGASASPSVVLSAPPSATAVAGSSTAASATTRSEAPSMTTSPSPSPSFEAVRLSLTSSAFGPNGPIPRKYTCDSEDVSPPLTWSGVPAGTKTLALVVDDPDANGFVHWVAYGIPADSKGLPEGGSTGSNAPAQGRNGFGKSGYGGPCPPSGTHRYAFKLYALDSSIQFVQAPTAADLRGAIEGHALATATLTGTYERG
jgi:Raf kinase inhibitor-like YbhB/YbcL family protein